MSISKVQIKNLLSKPVSAAYLGIFRIIFGSVMVLQFNSHFVRAQDYGQEGITRFLYPGLHFIPVADEATFRFLLWAGMLGSALMAGGLLFRWSAGLVFLIFSYIQLQDALHYNNHYYFFALLCFLLIFTHADRLFSVSSLRNNEPGKTTVPYLDYFILQLMVFIVYFYGGIAKLNGDWLSASVTRFMWPDVSEGTAIFIAWSGMVFDLLIGFLLFYKKTRWPAVFIAVLFNLTNALWFFGDIHLFPWAMIAATLLFIEPDWWERFTGKGEQGKKVKGRKSKKANKAKGKNSNSITNSNGYGWPGKPVLGTLVIFFVFQLLFPLRHYFIPGNVDWTGQGHYMAWRMKSYHKDVSIRFSTYDQQTGNLIKDYGNLGLSREAENRIGAFPHLVLQLAKEVDRQLNEGNPSPVKLRVDYLVAFNGKMSQNCVNPEAEVGKIRFSPFGNNDWILDIK